MCECASAVRRRLRIGKIGIITSCMPCLVQAKDKPTSSVGDEKLTNLHLMSTYSRIKGTTPHFTLSNPLRPSYGYTLASTPGCSPLTPPLIATRGSLGVEPTAARSPSPGPATNALAKGSRHSAIHTRAMASEECVYSPLRRLPSACVRYDRVVVLAWRTAIS